MLAANPRCHTERRLRSMMTMNAADLHHAAKALSRLPESPPRQLALEDALLQRETLKVEAARHLDSCETCFKSGASV